MATDASTVASPIDASPVSASSRWAPWLVALTTFVALCVARHEVLRLPPYHEIAMGVFNEANFLAETGFDYRRLRYEEPFAEHGGALWYMISVVPTLIALAMRACADAGPMLLVVHLASFASTGAMAGGFYALVRPVWNWPVALLLTAALMTMPLVLGQAELMSLDVPLTAGAVWATWCMGQHRYRGACLASTLAFAAKASGLILSMAAIVYLLGRLVFAERNVARRALVTALVGALLVLAAQYGIYQWSGIGKRFLGNDPINASMWAHLLVVCPEVLLLLAIGGVLELAAAWRAVGKDSSSGEGGRRSWPLRYPTELFSRDGDVAFAWIAAIGNLTAINVYMQNYCLRYFLLSTVLLAMIVARRAAAFCLTPARRAIAAGLCCGWVGLNLLNFAGRLYAPIPGHQRYYGMLERTPGEYLRDLRSHIAALRAIAAEESNTPLVVGYPFSYYAAMPRLGYVDRPLGGYSLNPFHSTQFASVAQLFRDRPSRLQFISIDNPAHTIGQAASPRFEPGDRLLYDDGQEYPLRVFEKDLSALEQDAAAYDRWLIEQMFFGQGAPRDRSGLISWRAELLDRWGIAGAARQLLELDATSGNPLTLLALAERYVAASQSAEAIRAARAGIEAAASLPEHQRRQLEAEGWTLIGKAHAVAGDWGEALVAHDHALASLPGFRPALEGRGQTLYFTGKQDEAISLYRQIVEADPASIDARYNLAVMLVGAGAHAEAVEVLRPALQRLATGQETARQRVDALLEQAQRGAAAGQP